MSELTILANKEDQQPKAIVYGEFGPSESFVRDVANFLHRVKNQYSLETATVLMKDKEPGFLLLISAKEGGVTMADITHGKWDKIADYK